MSIFRGISQNNNQVLMRERTRFAYTCEICNNHGAKMDAPLEQMNHDQLETSLLDAYAGLRDTREETAAIQMLKGELYRRGAERTDIVTIALAALIKQNLN